jgi:hypothetical protein
MEKNSLISVTEDELSLIRRGQTPKRLLTEFGDDPAKLKELVRAGEYTTIPSRQPQENSR